MIYDTSLDFCKFRIPVDSGRVIWEVTNECNYACSYCIFASTGRKPAGELDTKSIFRVLEELKEANFTHIKFTGGEPFLRDDMMDILEKSAQHGFIFDISTNASRFNESIALRLAQSQAEMIHISLDGYDQETHQAVRGKKSFNPTIKGLELLLSHRLRPPVRIGCVIHQYNQHDLLAMVQFCHRLGVEELVFSMMEPVGRMKEQDTKLANYPVSQLIEQIDEARAWLAHEQSSLKISHNLKTQIQPMPIYFNLDKKEKLHKSDVQCPGATRFLFINSLGMVSPCTWVSEYATTQFRQTLSTESLKKILDSDEFNQFSNLKKNIVGCPASLDNRALLSPNNSLIPLNGEHE
jgi:MoaA/NifB/PqqE/SkfB family radical SAM enzyme